MFDFILIAAPLTAMALAYLAVFYNGCVAGEESQQQRPCILGLVPAVATMIAQAALWVLWGLKIAGAI